eukprot:10364378-Alexandrium_andersonii.AAC.1
MQQCAGAATGRLGSALRASGSARSCVSALCGAALAAAGRCSARPRLSTLHAGFRLRRVAPRSCA